MMTRHKETTYHGFTIVELLIVIVIIAILASLAVVTFNGVQARARDAHSERNISAMVAQLKLYYSTHGYYPYIGAIVGSNGPAWIATNMPTLNDEVLVSWKEPDAVSSYTGNSSTPSGKYHYRAYTTWPTQCNDADLEGQCTFFFLRYHSEVTGASVTFDSRND